MAQRAPATRQGATPAVAPSPGPGAPATTAGAKPVAAPAGDGFIDDDYTSFVKVAGVREEARIVRCAAGRCTVKLKSGRTLEVPEADVERPAARPKK